MFNTIVGAGSVRAGAASRYGSGSGSDQKMRLRLRNTAKNAIQSQRSVYSKFITNSDSCSCVTELATQHEENTLVKAENKFYLHYGGVIQLKYPLLLCQSCES
jgi:hypothetical protein